MLFHIIANSFERFRWKQLRRFPLTLALYPRGEGMTLLRGACSARGNYSGSLATKRPHNGKPLCGDGKVMHRK